MLFECSFVNQVREDDSEASFQPIFDILFTMFVFIGAIPSACDCSIAMLADCQRDGFAIDI